MISRVARKLVIFAMLTELLLLFSPSAWAVPSYSRRFGEQCSTCHTMWGALNASGVQFRLSGYRAISGKDLKPLSEDIEISKGVSIPTTLPLSFITGVGFDSRNEKRQSDSGASVTAKGSSISLEDASIFMTSSLGKHLSAFVEFPMYETKAWEFTPLGRAEANNQAANRHVQFKSENPTFEVAKFFWNNLGGDSLPRDSFNLLGGITHLPLGYASGKVRLSVNQYLIYERRALDLISPKAVGDMLGSADDYLFRLGEPQILAEVNGMLTFGKPVADIGKRDTFWAEYHLGVTNGSNGKADNNTQKDFYGRWVMRYYNQSLGFSGFHSGDQYDDTLRSNAAYTGLPSSTGIMSGQQDVNRSDRFGIDFTLSLAPLGVPVWLENQYMFNKESNPTGFGKEFKWKGGFNQLNWQASKSTIVYGRFDWIKGDNINDTTVVSTVSGFNGVTNSTPKERDFILGWQHLVDQNVKLVAEYRHHVFEDNATSTTQPSTAKLSDDGVTLRAMIGF
ncbi:MAG: hypothetical protein KGZ83_12050 [Sulfuricella sp.]|nr:hypothetical protein [Sulfuricella sp.]